MNLMVQPHLFWSNHQFSLYFPNAMQITRREKRCLHVCMCVYFCHELVFEDMNLLLVSKAEYSFLIREQDFKIFAYFSLKSSPLVVNIPKCSFLEVLLLRTLD